MKIICENEKEKDTILDALSSYEDCIFINVRGNYHYGCCSPHYESCIECIEKNIDISVKGGME